MDEAGTLIADKYQLVEVAGSGGMATVWRAIQRGAAGFERPVGIKRIKEPFSDDPKFRTLFVEEARVSSQLVHPNIVQIYDFGDDNGRYFLVMEWVEGLSLSRYLTAMHELRFLPPWYLIAAVAIEALRALAAAHERLDMYGQPAPVIHRDVTPQNILMGANGVVKLTDFGLARAMDRVRMTAPDVIKGKVGYLAPEMVQNRMASPLTDIYALGVVLWQALSGRKLFDGKDDLEIFVAASRGEIPPLVEARPDIPQHFASIVERALARDPVDRFQSADQMSRVIAKLLRTVSDLPDGAMISRSVADVRGFLTRGTVPTDLGTPVVG